MDIPLQQRVALVTGGSRGIGRGICLQLAKLGIGVAINYRHNRQSAEEVASIGLDLGAAWAQTFAADVSLADDRQRMLGELRQATGRLDILVNNAGITSPVRGEMLDLTEQNWDAVLATNLKGPFFLTQEVARWMIEQRSTGVIETGTVVNISSISAYVASTARAEYCISKAGISMMTQLFAHRLANDGILVYEVRPGIIRTDMTAGAIEKYDRLIADGLSPIRRWGTADDVGKAVAMISQGHLSFSTGEVINVDGGFHSRHL